MSVLIWKFQLPEENEEAVIHNNATKLYSTFLDLLDTLRKECKYDDEMTMRSSEQVRNMIYDALKEREVNLDELGL